jgi:hypothetical protein
VFDFRLTERNDCPRDLKCWQEVRCTRNGQDGKKYEIPRDPLHSHLGFRLQCHEWNLAYDVCGIVCIVSLGGLVRKGMLDIQATTK